MEYLDHTHYANPLSIFSDGDIIAYFAYMHFNKVVDKNSFTLTVETSQGTTYAMVLNNASDFNSFYNSYVSTQDQRDSFAILFGGFVKSTNTINQNEMVFLR